MWIKFTSSEKFAVKLHVGGVNAVSGEPSYETEQTQNRRYKRLSENKSIQDYVVTPDQLWLDGIASADGTVRQFVAVAIPWSHRSLAWILLVGFSWRWFLSRRNTERATNRRRTPMLRLRLQALALWKLMSRP
jgi:hypothetical protein